MTEETKDLRVSGDGHATEAWVVVWKTKTSDLAKALPGWGDVDLYLTKEGAEESARSENAILPQRLFDTGARRVVRRVLVIFEEEE